MKLKLDDVTLACNFYVEIEGSLELYALQTRFNHPFRFDLSSAEGRSRAIVYIMDHLMAAKAKFEHDEKESEK